MTQFQNITLDFIKNELCRDFTIIQNRIDADMKDVDFIKNSEFKSRILKGFMQSRKTWSIISISLYYYIVYNISVIIVIENKLSACEQIVRRIKNVFTMYMNFTDFNSFFKIIDIERGKNVSDEEFKKAITRENPKIFICLRSEFDLEPVNKNIENVNTSKKNFITILDECDAIDTVSESKAQEQIYRLKNSSSVIWNVTATSLTSLLKEEIQLENIFILNPPDGYKDITCFNMFNLTKEVLCCDEVKDDPFQKDKNLKEYIDNFAKSTPYIEFQHPVICLIRNSIVVNPQIKIAEYIYENFKNDIVVITYNGSGYGTTIRGCNLPYFPITIDKHNVSTYENHTHTFKDCHIGDILSYLQDYGGISKYPRIIIISGKMADRGITFTSTNYTESKIPWHLTEMYYVVSQTTDQPNLLQACGRLCGIYKDTISLKLYSNAIEDITKAYYCQEELLHRCKQRIEKNYLTKELIPAIPISKNKCCKKRRFTAPKIHCKLNKVKDDSVMGGWKWNNNNIQEKDNTQYNNCKIEQDEYIRLVKRFEMWSKSNTGISQVMQNLSSDKVYTKLDLQELFETCGLSRNTSILDFCRYKRENGSNGYGKILLKVENGYIIHPELQKEFSNYFLN